MRRRPAGLLIIALTASFALSACASPHATDTIAANGAVVRHGTIPSNQGDRSYRAYIPKSLAPNGNALVIALHGSGGDADSFAPVTGFDALAETGHFVAVYPDGYHQTWNAGRCCGDAVIQGSGDVAFIRGLIELFEADPTLHIDPAAIYVSGFSLGGMMAYRIGCELADRIAAIGVVSGVLVYESCQPSRSVPLVHIHGTSDHVVPYEGQTPPDGLPSVAISIARWESLSPGVDVQLITIDGGGHIWPRDVGNSPSLSGIRAADVLWQFFRDHRRPPP